MFNRTLKIKNIFTAMTAVGSEAIAADAAIN